MKFDFWMHSYIGFWLFILGSVMGSFLDCAAYRYVRGEAWPKGRSYCDKCGHILAPKDMVPIFSFLFFKGRCSYCGKSISRECLIVELFTAVLFSVLGIHLGWSLKLIMYLALCSFLILITLIDWKIHIIPDVMVIAIMTNRLIFFFLENGIWLKGFLHMLLGACSVAIPLLLLSLGMDFLLKKESMGGGDIKLLFALGMYMTWIEMLLLLFVGCLIALIYIFFVTKKEKHSEFAFGPFLSCAWVFVFLFGETIIEWYQSLLF